MSYYSIYNKKIKYYFIDIKNVMRYDRIHKSSEANK